MSWANDSTLQTLDVVIDAELGLLSIVGVETLFLAVALLVADTRIRFHPKCWIKYGKYRRYDYTLSNY